MLYTAKNQNISKYANFCWPKRKGPGRGIERVTSCLLARYTSAFLPATQSQKTCHRCVPGLSRSLTPGSPDQPQPCSWGASFLREKKGISQTAAQGTVGFTEASAVGGRGTCPNHRGHEASTRPGREGDGEAGRAHSLEAFPGREPQREGERAS